MHPERLSDLRKGLPDLKVGALLSLLANVILLVALLSSLSRLPMYPPTLGQPELLFLAFMVASASFMLLVVVAALVTSLVALFKFLRAAGHLKRFDAPKLGVGRIGVLLEIVGVVMALLGLIASMSLSMTSAPLTGSRYSSSSVGAVIGLVLALVVGAIGTVIGKILFSVMLMRLGEVEGLDSGFENSGILYLADTLVAFIALIASNLVSLLALILEIVAFILIYRCSENSLRSLAGALM
ncbi:MAG: DUF973 family protein [Candidatus Korarchaeum sp.]